MPLVYHVFVSRTLDKNSFTKPTIKEEELVAPCLSEHANNFVYLWVVFKQNVLQNVLDAILHDGKL